MHNISNVLQVTSNHRLLHHLIPSSLRLGPIHSDIMAKVPQSMMVPAWNIISHLLLVRLTTEISTLAPLPELNTSKEKHRLDEHNTPLPRNSRMLKDAVVDDGDINDGEGKYEASHNTPEQELVVPNIVHPLGEVTLRMGLHPEEAASQVHHLPGEE